MMKLTREEKIRALIEKHVLITDTCWLWRGALKEKGYGQVTFERRNVRVHRLMYEFFKGEIPQGLILDHLCRVRRCCNPDHLEAVTPKTNSQRGYWGTKVTCIHGHEYSEENTRIDSNGHRKCRECKRGYDRKSADKAKARVAIGG